MKILKRKWKKMIAIVLAVLMVSNTIDMSMTVYAEDNAFTVDNLTYQILTVSDGDIPGTVSVIGGGF